MAARRRVVVARLVRSFSTRRLRACTSVAVCDAFGRSGCARAAVADLLDFPATSFPLIAPYAAACRCVRARVVSAVVSRSSVSFPRSSSLCRARSLPRAASATTERVEDEASVVLSTVAPPRLATRSGFVRRRGGVSRRTSRSLGACSLLCGVSSAGHLLRIARAVGPANIFRRRPGGRRLSLAATCRAALSFRFVVAVVVVVVCCHAVSCSVIRCILGPRPSIASGLLPLAHSPLTT